MNGFVKSGARARAKIPTAFVYSLIGCALVCSSATADVWIARESQLQRLAPGGSVEQTITQAFGHNLNTRGGIKVDPRDGSLWVFDRPPSEKLGFTRFVMKLSATGEGLFQRKIGTAIRGKSVVVGFDAVRDGTWVSWGAPDDSNPFGASEKLVLLDDRDGARRVEVGGFTVIGAVAVGADGAIWVLDYYGADTEAWVRLTGSRQQLAGYDASAPTGPHHRRFTDLGGFTTRAIGIDQSDGSVWITAHASDPPQDFCCAYLVKLTADGQELLRVHPTGFGSLTFVDVDPRDGSVWASDSLIGTGIGGSVAHLSALGETLAEARYPDMVGGASLDETDGSIWMNHVPAMDDNKEGFPNELLKLDATLAIVDRVPGNIYGFNVDDRGASSSVISIDIEPADSLNRVDPSGDYVRVAILSSPTFDPLQVDVGTVRFGIAGAVATAHWTRDVNRDGVADLVAMFRTAHTGIKCGDDGAPLSAETFGGTAVRGTGLLTTIGCGP